MRKTALGAMVALTVFMVGCGEGVSDVTTGSGPSATPTPVPTATPAATATPTATPAPGALITCKLPKLSNCDASCCTNGGSVIFRTQIEEAQEELQRTQPGLFLSNGDVRDNFQYVIELGKVFTNRNGGNICAEGLSHDELRVKGDQNVSQHVDVLISDKTPWVGGAYTCRPASF